MKHIGNGSPEDTENDRIRTLTEALACREEARRAVPLVKFRCGCVGFPPSKQGFAVILEACDAHHDDPALFGGARDMQDKSYESLSPEMRDRVVKMMETAFRKAHDYDQIRIALRVNH